MVASAIAAVAIVAIIVASADGFVAWAAARCCVPCCCCVWVCWCLDCAVMPLFLVLSSVLLQL
eukprot:14666153-Alexandrium_andersonii.AAC.1